MEEWVLSCMMCYEAAGDRKGNCWENSSAWRIVKIWWNYVGVNIILVQFCFQWNVQYFNSKPTPIFMMISDLVKKISLWYFWNNVRFFTSPPQPFLYTREGIKYRIVAFGTDRAISKHWRKGIKRRQAFHAVPQFPAIAQSKRRLWTGGRTESLKTECHIQEVTIIHEVSCCLC